MDMQNYTDIQDHKEVSRIPVVMGVTGHRDLRDEDIEILRSEVKAGLEALRQRYPNTPLIMMTCLAEGADQLCAEVALETGTELISVLPMPLGEYAKDFETAALDRLLGLAEASAEVIVSPVLEPYDERFGTERDWRYRQAGLYIAKHSHVLIALWDGTEGDPDGCGTASIAAAMLNGTFGQSESRQLHPADRAVVQIAVPRSSRPDAGTAGRVIVHGDAGILEKQLIDTEIFNSDASKQSREASPQEASSGKASPQEASSGKALPQEASSGKSSLQKASSETASPSGANGPAADPVLQRLTELYDTADRMSVENAVKHTRFLACLSVAATALAMAFLIYDEADWFWMIVVCGIMIAVLFAVNAFGDKSRYQARYLEYRVLAEMLRVQIQLRRAGVSCEVSEIMPWNLQISMPWIRSAVSAAVIGEAATGRSRIKESWVIDQRDYHRSALGKSVQKLKSNDRIIHTALVMTLVIYAFALIFEIGCGGLSGGRYLFSPEVNETIRMYIKIAMGTFSAGTLFASNYYGKQALPNVIDDHRKMAALYEEAADEIDRLGESEELLIRLAEDELNENANWYAYQSKSEPDLGI